MIPQHRGRDGKPMPVTNELERRRLAKKKRDGNVDVLLALAVLATACFVWWFA